MVISYFFAVKIRAHFGVSESSWSLSSSSQLIIETVGGGGGQTHHFWFMCSFYLLTVLFDFISTPFQMMIMMMMMAMMAMMAMSFLFLLLMLSSSEDPFCCLFKIASIYLSIVFCL